MEKRNIRGESEALRKRVGGGWGESQRKVKPKACLSTGDVLCENREVGGWRRGVTKEVAECGRLERWMAEDGRRRVAGEDVVWQS